MFKSEVALTEHEQKHASKQETKQQTIDTQEYEKALEKVKLLPDILNKEKFLKDKLAKLIEQGLVSSKDLTGKCIS